MTRGRYVAPLPAQPPVELTKEQRQVRATYTQLGVAAATLSIVYQQLVDANIPDDVLARVRDIGGYVEDQMWTLNFLHGTMVTQGCETLPKLRDKK